MKKSLKVRAALASVALVAAFANADVTPYGFARFNGAWSDGTGGENPNGVGSAAPNAEKGEYRFGLGAGQSRLGFNISGPSFEGGAILTGKVEGDFVPGNLRIRHAYTNLSFPNVGLDILIGQSWDVFSPNDPAVVNGNGWVTQGNLAGSTGRQPQIRLTQKLGGSALISVSAVSDRGNNDAPAVQGRIALTSPITFGVSGHFASRTTAGPEDTANVKGVSSWSAVADLSAPIGKISINGEFFYGQNLAGYGGISKVNGEDATTSLGGWGALGFKATSNLSFNLGAGLEHAKDNPVEANTLQTNGAGFVNLQYKLAPTATLALEYFRAQSEYTDKTKGNFNRVETSLTYGF